MVNLLFVQASDELNNKFTIVQTQDHQGTNSNTADTSIIHYEDPHYPQGTSKTVSYNNNQQYRYVYTNSSNEINFLKRKSER
jgi:hypothetical protein